MLKRKLRVVNSDNPLLSGVRRTKLFCVCAMPDRPSKLACDIGAMGKLGEKMTNPMTDLDAYTDAELEQALARVLAQARGEVLNEAEVQKFWQLYEEIQRRALSVTAA